MSCNIFWQVFVEGKLLKQSGMCEKWLEKADDKTKSVVGNVNGPLLSMLLKASGYVDSEAADLLRQGRCPS